jgi:hypothetical protein
MAMAQRRFRFVAQIPALRRCSVVVCATLLFVTAALASLSARQSEFPGIPAARGQDVSPTFDGWERNPDGTINMYFGYYNRNSQEEVDVPLGAGNAFDLGNGDQGQPTHFYPGRKWFVFKVVVPKDWPSDKRLVWTLANRGRTNLAKGWLEAEWEVEAAGIFLNGYRDRVPAYGSAENLPTVAVTGGPSQTITLPAKATLSATATVSGSSNTDVEQGVNPKGIQVRWILYRGPGSVQFDPAASPPVKGKPVMSETQLTFGAPGTYRIRAIGTDGALFSTYDFDVNVNPDPSAKKGT